MVLVHDGLYGRSHLYSYVKQRDKWWKIVDYSTLEVCSHCKYALVTLLTEGQVSEETVLHDPIGLHLNAGPFFLIYSRAIPEESLRPDWPENVKVCMICRKNLSSVSSPTLEFCQAQQRLIFQ